MRNAIENEPVRRFMHERNHADPTARLAIENLRPIPRAQRVSGITFEIKTVRREIKKGIITEEEGRERIGKLSHLYNVLGLPWKDGNRNRRSGNKHRK